MFTQNSKLITEENTPSLAATALGLAPKKAFFYKNESAVFLYDNEEQIKQLSPDMNLLKQLNYSRIIVTAKGTDIDFVSRVFYPNKIASEDAVTGASHCFLVPYWAKQLKKTQLSSAQLSQRGGSLLCELKNDRVFLSGQAVLYMEGSICYGLSVT